MFQILRLIAYLGAIAIGALIAASHGARRRSAIAFLFIYIAVLHAGVVITRKESWPFGNYQALHGKASIDVYIWRMEFVGVDRNGREWLLDPWAFDSVYRIPLQMWAVGYLKKLSPPQQQDALAYMLGVAERSRQRQAAGQRVGAERWLGMAAMPNWYALQRVETVSPEPFTRLRLYYVEWTARKRVEHRSLYAESAAR